MLFTFVTGILIAAPLYIVLASWGFAFTPRMDQVADRQLNWTSIISLTDGGAALKHYFNDNLLPPILHIIQRTDTSRLYYGGETPLILGFMLPTFFLGVFHAVWRWRVAGSLVLLWVVLVIAGNSLLSPIENTFSVRYMVVFPALALLMAMGIRFTIPVLLGRSQLDSRFSWRSVYGGLMLTVAGLLALLQVIYYFRDHLPFYNEQIRPPGDYIDVFFRARALPADTPIFIITDNGVYLPHYDLLGKFWDFHPHITVLAPSDLAGDDLRAFAPGEYAFFIDPDDQETLRSLTAYFASVEGPLWSPYDVPSDKQYVEYVVHIPKPP